MTFTQTKNIAKGALPIGARFTTSTGAEWEVIEHGNTHLVAKILKTGNMMPISYGDAISYLRDGFFMQKGGRK